jgi:hypothetical protein
MNNNSPNPNPIHFMTFSFNAIFVKDRPDGLL